MAKKKTKKVSKVQKSVKKRELGVRSINTELTREEAEGLFYEFLQEETAEARDSLMLLLEDGFVGFSNMSNKDLAEEVEQWNLLARESSECGRITVTVVN